LLPQRAVPGEDGIKTNVDFRELRRRMRESEGHRKVPSRQREIGLAFKTSATAMAESQIPKWRARNDSKGVRLDRRFSEMFSVSETKSSKRGNKVRKEAARRSLRRCN
jgi:hypothetical protein